MKKYMKLENGINLPPLQLQQKSTGAARYSSYPLPPASFLSEVILEVNDDQFQKFLHLQVDHL